MAPFAEADELCLVEPGRGGSLLDYVESLPRGGNAHRAKRFTGYEVVHRRVGPSPRRSASPPAALGCRSVATGDRLLALFQKGDVCEDKPPRWGPPASTQIWSWSTARACTGSTSPTRTPCLVHLHRADPRILSIARSRANARLSPWSELHLRMGPTGCSYRIGSMPRPCFVRDFDADGDTGGELGCPREIPDAILRLV